MRVDDVDDEAKLVKRGRGHGGTILALTLIEHY